MRVGKQMSRLMLATIAATAIAAPAASAMPALDGATKAEQDMHASTVAADLRSEATRGAVPSDAAPAGKAAVPSDLRSEAAKGPETSTPPAGLPTWPLHPEPIVPAQPKPVAATDTGDGSVDWPLVALIAAGAIALAGASVATIHQVRVHAGATR